MTKNFKYEWTEEFEAWSKKELLLEVEYDRKNLESLLQQNYSEPEIEQCYNWMKLEEKVLRKIHNA